DRYFFRFPFLSLGSHPDLLSFPTRRSSDLNCACDSSSGSSRVRGSRTQRRAYSPHRFPHDAIGRCSRAAAAQRAKADLCQGADRSEEHTSELQSRENLVCRLLLEKKKQKHT